MIATEYMYQETRLKTIIFLHMATAMGDAIFWIRRELINRAGKRGLKSRMPCAAGKGASRNFPKSVVP
jgi:hypothetical protein